VVLLENLAINLFQLRRLFLEIEVFLDAFLSGGTEPKPQGSVS
jgi:hypothetical protein